MANYLPKFHLGNATFPPLEQQGQKQGSSDGDNYDEPSFISDPVGRIQCQSAIPLLLPKPPRNLIVYLLVRLYNSKWMAGFAKKLFVNKATGKIV
jgi:hypothetical protein